MLILTSGFLSYTVLLFNGNNNEIVKPNNYTDKKAWNRIMSKNDQNGNAQQDNLYV